MPLQPMITRTRWVGALAVLWLAAGPLRGDVVTLNSGGTVHGNVTSSNGTKTVSVHTSAGALLIFEKEAVKTVKHGADPSQKGTGKTAVGKTGAAKTSAAKPHLTPEEEAWMPKIRSLVARLFESDRDQIRRAKSELLNVNDANAIPALTRYLWNTRNEDARLLYTFILRNMPGSKPVYYLVQLSIFDPSAHVRDEARQAIGAGRADQARPLYIQALKFGIPDLASLAAQGIAAIGDPNRESVPYLIDGLIVRSTREVAAGPGVRFAVPDSWVLPQPSAPSAPAPVPLPASGFGMRAASPAPVSMGMGGSSSLPMGLTNRLPQPLIGTVPPLRGPASTTSFPVSYQGALNTPITPPPTVKIEQKDANIPVLDALIKITGQDFGLSRDNWGRWWVNDQKNRTLQKPKAVDRVISKPAAPLDSTPTGNTAAGR
jgi:hypothetical protein